MNELRSPALMILRRQEQSAARRAGRLAVLALLAALLVVLGNSCRVTEPRPAARETSCPPSTCPVPTPAPEPTILDTGLAYGVPCKPPCWQGLTPGETTRQEAASILAQLRSSGQVNSIVEGPVSFHVYPVLGMTGAVRGYFEEGVLREIRGLVKFDYTLGDLIEQFGPPEGFYPSQLTAVNVRAPCSSCDLWHPPPGIDPYVLTWFLYPSQGLAFYVFVPGSGLGCLCPEMRVGWYCFYAPCSIGEGTNSCGDVCLGKLEELSAVELGKWHGFGGEY